MPIYRIPASHAYDVQDLAQNIEQRITGIISTAQDRNKPAPHRT
jgi:hypothetical protein